MRTRSIATLLVICALLAACSSGPGAGGTLEGTKWILRSYEQAGALVLVPETEYADAEFTSNRVRGFSGCNNYDAVYRTGGRTLFISHPAVTLMACAESSMTFEQTYLQLLDSSRFYSVRNDTLTIYSGIGSTVLVFDAAPKNPLLGKWVVDSFETAPSTVSALVPGTEIEVVFGIGSVGGFAGCNSFSGTYGTNGNLVRIGRLATTRQACAQDVMDQEAAFIQALEGAALIETRNRSVNLTDLKGSLVVALVRPVIEEEAAASASPGSSVPAVATPKPTAAPAPTPSPTPRPTPTPTPAPTQPPAESSRPSLSPPSIAPPSIAPPAAATCDLKTASGATVANIAYPGSWYTVTDPANLACQYFSPDPITVPSDPSTLTTAIQASVADTAYADAVAAATDASAWTVQQQAPLTLDGLTATRIEATATTDAAGIPVGSSRFAYLVDVGSAGTVTLWTTGTAGDENFDDVSGIVSLMAEFSTFQAPS
jgi:heat shock protein HslJ